MKLTFFRVLPHVKSKTSLPLYTHTKESSALIPTVQYGTDWKIAADAAAVAHAVIARLLGNCLICLDAPTKPTTTSCCLGGVYCADCIAYRAMGDNPACPICREVLFHEMLLDVPASPENTPGHTTLSTGTVPEMLH